MAWKYVANIRGPQGVSIDNPRIVVDDLVVDLIDRDVTTTVTVGNVRGPKGDKGDKGDTGDTGPSGGSDAGTAAFILDSGSDTRAALNDAIAAEMPVASPTVRGAVELATADETATGTDSERAVTPAALATWLGRGRVHVIVAAGQSNMEGRGTPLPTTTTDPVHPRIFQYGAVARTIAAASEPLNNVDGNSSGMGPALQFARRLIRTLPTTDRVLIVPCAKGSTPLVGTGTDAWQWGGNAGNLSARAVTQTQEAIAAALLQWLAPASVAAYLWVQGERDGEPNAVTRDTYLTQLKALVNGFRGALGDAPFIIGQMVPEGIPTGTRAQINEAHSMLPTELTACGFGLGPAGSHIGDSLHYNAAGQRKLGKSMFNEFQRVQAGLAPVTAVQAASSATLTLAPEMQVQRGIVSFTDPSTSPSTQSVVFPVPFETVPEVVAESNINGDGTTVWAYTASITRFGFTMRVRTNLAITGTRTISWIATAERTEA